VKNVANAARLREHAPDFGGHAIKVEIRTGPHAQYDYATVNIDRGWFTVLNKDTIGCDAQSAGLHCSTVIKSANRQYPAVVIACPGGLSVQSTR
jgi:hypothetical protein